MNHEWKRGADGKPIVSDNDWPYFVTCRLCGEVADVSYGTDEDPVVEGCEGVDLKPRVKVLIWHPGRATEEDDGEPISRSIEIDMAQLLGAETDLVSEALVEAIDDVAARWRERFVQHRDDWEAAVKREAQR